jgi:hypothetical protein
LMAFSRCMASAREWKLSTYTICFGFFIRV